MKTVPRNVRVVTQDEAARVPDLPEQVSLALADIAAVAREGLLAMSVAAGMAVMQAMFEAEITAVAGAKGKHNPDRQAVRHGTGKGSVTLGGRRVEVTRPRARTVDGHEVALQAYSEFAADDLLSQVVLERMLAGVATRRHARIGEPLGTAVRVRSINTAGSAAPGCHGGVTASVPVRCGRWWSRTISKSVHVCRARLASAAANASGRFPRVPTNTVRNPRRSWSAGVGAWEGTAAAGESMSTGLPGRGPGPGSHASSYRAVLGSSNHRPNTAVSGGSCEEYVPSDCRFSACSVAESSDSNGTVDGGRNGDASSCARNDASSCCPRRPASTNADHPRKAA